MSYVDAIHDKERDIVHVVERVNGKREFKEIPAKYTFYYKEQRGRYTSIFGEKLERVVCNTSKSLILRRRLTDTKACMKAMLM